MNRESVKCEGVLLVAVNAKYIHSNLAVYSLRANAGSYAERVEIAEYTINHSREEILRGIYERSPGVVGFSCYIWNIQYVLDVAADLRKVLPDAVIVLGGPEVSYDAPRVLESCPFVDAVLVGEGEVTFREFLERWFSGVREVDWEGFGDIPGLCLRAGGEVCPGDDREVCMRTAGGFGVRRGGEPCLTPPRPPADLDALAFPYEAVGGLDNRILYYETMRGCPFSCSYCLSSVERGVRFRSLSKVFQELRFFLDQRVGQVKFVDRTFNCHHEHAYRIWEYIAAHDNGVTNFHFEIGGDLLREEDFALFQTFRAGLVQFEIGVQSTNPTVIAEIRRKMDLSRLAKNLSLVRQTRRIHQHVDLIAGLPYEDASSFRRSFNEVYAMMPDQLQLGFLKLLKGSYMDEKKEEYGIGHADRPPYEVLFTRWLSYRDILELKRVEEMVEIYYNSFQFRATVALLELCHTDACAVFENLGRFCSERGYFGAKHSRVARYEIVWEYVSERFADRVEEFRQTLTYDLYLRDYVKNPPAFVRRRGEKYLEAVRAFLEAEARRPEVLCGYEGYKGKQLFHMVYVDEFDLDMDRLANERQLRRIAPHTLVFDYRNRSPLNHNAGTIEISLALCCTSVLSH